MSSSRKVVELFYDVVSPYSWLGFEVLCRYTALWNIDLKLRPAFLGGVMKESGNRPPAMVPNKALYLNTDLTRLAEYFDIPLHHPANPFEVMFEKGSLAAMRFLTAVAEKEQPNGVAVVERVSRELWKRIWSTDQDITQPSSFSEVQAARPPSPHQPQPGSTSTCYTAPAACNPRPPPKPVTPATLLQPFSTNKEPKLYWNSSVHFHQSKQVLEAIKVCSQLGNQGIGPSA